MIAETIVDLEVTSACCLSCSFCPRNKIKRDNIRINFNHVSKLAESIGLGKIVWLSGLGEPLLICPNLEINRLKATGAKVFSNSNASFSMFPQNLDKCISAGLSFLNVSIYGWDDESYKQTTGVDVFLLVLKNIRHAIKTNIPMRLSYVETESSPKDAKEKISQAFSFDKVRLLKEHGRANCIEQQSPPDKCALCWNYMFISSDGIALPCVNDVEAKHDLGTDYEKVMELKKNRYPWDICAKCDCGGRFASFKPGFLDKVQKLDEKKGHSR